MRMTLGIFYGILLAYMALPAIEPPVYHIAREGSASYYLQKWCNEGWVYGAPLASGIKYIKTC